MTIEEALVAHLTTYPALATLVGDRVEPTQRTQGTSLQSIDFTRAGLRPTQHRSSTRANFGRNRFQFDLWGGTYTEVMHLADVFKDAMAAFARPSDPRVDVSLLQDEQDAFEAEPGQWRRTLDYHIWHEGV